MTDTLAALIQILMSDVTVNALVNGRIYDHDLPYGENANMPRKNIIIKTAGGYLSNKLDTLVFPRFDIWMYAETKQEAYILDHAVYDCLILIERKSIINILIHAVELSDGALIDYEPETNWPMAIHTIRVKTDERKIN